MKTIFIGSVEDFSLKSFMVLGLGKLLEERGYVIGYIKPLSRDNSHYDIVRDFLDLHDPVEDVYPVSLTEELLIRAFMGDYLDVHENIGVMGGYRAGYYFSVIKIEQAPIYLK